VRFIAENTVEERILQLQEKKRLVFDGTVGRLVTNSKLCGIANDIFSTVPVLLSNLLPQGCRIFENVDCG
jgi:hypothetical protein